MITQKLVKYISFALAVSFLCLNPASIQAQTLYGTIAGQVQDQQGAAIGKAEVTVRNVETGATRKVNADDSGAYQVTSIQPGTYEVSASIAGFKTEVRSGIGVTVGAEVAVNFSLTVGAVTEKVEVTAEAAQVDTSSATLGGFVNSTTIRELPLNGRDWISLSLLQPGVSPNASQNRNDLSAAQRGNGLSLYISGGRHTDNAFRIDGVSVNDYANGGPGSALRVNMGVDAIREFSVLTNSYSAEYGRGAGGVVNAITKSGTNELHGGAYYFHRNSALDARNFFDVTHDPAPFRRHQFGGYVGGRIIKDKTFYFANYEQLTEVKGLSANDPTISADAQKGLLCNNPCTSKTQFPVSPRTGKFISLYPLPNAPTAGDTGFFSFNPKRGGREKYITSKLDHYFSPSTTFFMSYTWDDSFVGAPDNFGLKDTFAVATRQYAVMSLQHIFSPTLINNARAGVSRFLGGNAFDGNPHDPRLTDLSYGFVPGNPFGQIIVNGVSLGTSNGVLNGLQSSGQNFFGYTSPQFYDDVSWTKGRHTIKIGANLEHILYNTNEANKPNGGWVFASIKDFVTGNLSSSGTLFQSDLPATDTFRSERTSIIGGYIQDDFRMRPNLTINLGLRYEMATMVDEVHNRIANLRTGLADPTITVGRPYYNPPKAGNFAPRIGFAWDPFKDGKTSIRGGAGMFDVLTLPYMLFSRYPRSAPFFLGGQVLAPPDSTFPNNGVPLLQATTLTVVHIEYNPHRAYRMQWNLNIQRQLTRNLALTLGYSGSSGVHIIHQEEDTNEVPATLVHFDSAIDSYIFPLVALSPGKKAQVINPNFGSIRTSDWSGQSNYHGFQANLVQRPVKGLSYQLAYTWSKSIDNGSGVFQAGNESFNTAAASWAFDPRINRGVSDYDIPHNFVANFQYDVPTPAFAKNGVAKTVLGGWQLGGIYTRQTGAPFTFRIGADRAGTGSHQVTQSNGAQRPQLLGNLPGCSSPTTGNIDDYILKSCFQFPALGQLGNEGRNIMRMPVFRNLDFTVFKNQNLWGERVKAQLRVEMFNILNNSNLTANMQSIFDGAGNIPTPIGKPLAPTANAARTIQLGLRLVF